MPIELTDSAFGRLLDHLDRDRARAADRYEELRRILVRFFEWRSAPFPEELADATFDRVARKLAEGVMIENIGAYSYGVARLVALEALKGPEAMTVLPVRSTCRTPDGNVTDARGPTAANRPFSTSNAPFSIGAVAVPMMSRAPS